MPATITRKSDVRLLLAQCLNAYESAGLNACVQEVDLLLLSRKVKFPLLEFCGRSLYTHLPDEEQIPFCDAIQKLKTEGGNVLLGIILQERLTDHFQECITKTSAYIAAADIWYVCDIIGERVWGVSLLQTPEKTIPIIERLMKHPSQWVLRSLGAGIHYAIKKGLEKEYVSQLFPLLISAANTQNKEIRQGVGWAAKTTAKFHPAIIEFHESAIQDKTAVANWFRAKINIGLQRNSYGERN